MQYNNTMGESMPTCIHHIDDMQILWLKHSQKFASRLPVSQKPTCLQFVDVIAISSQIFCHDLVTVPSM